MKKAFFIIVTAFLCASFSILFSACSRQTHREENFESVSIEKTITDNRHESSREEQVTIRETNCVHSWNEATCQEPKTCVLCGETDGEPLGHDLTAANYQQPETCARCGKSFGNVIPAYYDVNNLRSYVRGEYLTEKQLDDWSGSYSFTFICGYNKNNEPIHCKVSCEEKSDDLSLMRVASEYELSLDAEDGWRWRLIRVCMEIDTAELTEEGTNLSLVFFDRYTGLIEFHDKIVSSYYGNPIECPIISKGDTYIATTADNTVLQEIKLDYFIYQPMEYDGIGVAWYNRTVNEQGETKIVFSEVEEEQEVLDRVSQAGVFDPVIIPMLSGGMPARFLGQGFCHTMTSNSTASSIRMSSTVFRGDFCRADCPRYRRGSLSRGAQVCAATGAGAYRGRPNLKSHEV